ncbi:venom allergen 5-like [Palaemon carinicauda]|uniref:venom allergen 5-like n=1 Tax=Palaemon carinicauda TaxID=392227 RepID=UPI0035B65ADE
MALIRATLQRNGISQFALMIAIDYELKQLSVAQGNETRGAPGPQPAGANIRELKWNDELAKVAQAWADQCINNQESSPYRKICSRSYEVGQNIVMFGGSLNDTVMWANTYEIGCGHVHYNTTNSERKIYVCNYGPAGNIPGEEIYAQGTAASQCINGISTTYPDLCA